LTDAVFIPHLYRMSQIDSMFAVAAAFGEARQIGEARISTIVFNDGRRLKRVREGADIGARSIERALQWFSDHWPEGAEWPSDVPRPERHAPEAHSEVA
jgi:hypothetical protein